MKALVSKFALKYPEHHQFVELPLSIPGWFQGLKGGWLKLLRDCFSADLVFISNPQPSEMALCYFLKLLRKERIRVFYFDLIMRPPSTGTERVLARIKRILLSKVDVFLFIHKDVSGYTEHFGIARHKCRYVPFKANNYDLVNRVAAERGEYALSLGASHRDYDLLLQAIAGTPIPLKIILPQSSITAHNAKLSRAEQLPSNVDHITTPVDRIAWSEYIARSRFVVIPLLRDIIQPAGISVYLEAMIFGKPVIVTAGPSTNGILDGSLAVLVPPGDSESMRRAMLELWHDPDRADAIGSRAKAYALSLKDHSRLLADVRSIIDDEMKQIASAQPPI